MTDLTKLADDLRAAALKAPDRATSRAMFEAAHILRSAASLDMTGFMAMHDAAAEARRVLVSGGNVPQVEADRSRLSRAALESALRLALAAREWQPIETAPKDGRSMLLGYPNGAGKWRTVRGQWFSDAEIAETWEEDGDEGWYETSVECEDLPNCWAIEPTHWMPLPAAAPKGTT